MSVNSSKRASWLSFFLGAATIVGVGLLWQGLGAPSVAYGQMRQSTAQLTAFDSGKQRNDMIKELRAANSRLTEISSVLKEIRNAQKSEQNATRAKPAQREP